MKSKSLKRCNKSTSKIDGKSKRRKPKKKSRSRKMRGGSNPNVLDLGQGSRNLKLLTSNYNTSIKSKYQFNQLKKFTDKIKNDESIYNGKQIVDLIYNTHSDLPGSLTSPFKQFDHDLVSNGKPKIPITAGLPGTHIYVLVEPSSKSILNILGIVTNP